MGYHEKLVSAVDAYVAASVKTQAAQEDHKAAAEILNKAEEALEAAVGSEDVAFAALMELRQDVLDGGWDAPAEPAPEAPVELPVDVPAPLPAPLPEEAAPVVEEEPQVLDMGEASTAAPVEVAPEAEAPVPEEPNTPLVDNSEQMIEAPSIDVVVSDEELGEAVADAVGIPEEEIF